MHRTRADGLALSTPLVVIGAAAAGWAFLLAGAGSGMDVVMMSTIEFPPPSHHGAMNAGWDLGRAIATLVMWWGMMLAMMLPGVAEKARQQALACRRACPDGDSGSWLPAAMFCAGYAAPWLLFSFAASLLQYGLESAGLINGMMMWSSSIALSAGLLLLAGLYQLSPAKQRALGLCRDGRTVEKPGITGLKEATACVANSTPLMLLLFVGGVMNLAWIVALMAINLLERQLPNPRLFSLGVGVICILAAIYLVVISGLGRLG